MSRKLPPSASVANPLGAGKLHAPSAERNLAALCDLLLSHAPKSGNALEIASGTGQHITQFATRLPGLHWHPTDIEADRLTSINAYTGELPNVAPALHLNAAQAGWAAKTNNHDLIFLANLLHLIPSLDAKTILSEVALALSPKGTFIVYGPFKRAGSLTSEGDARFHAQLQDADPAIGYKDDTEMIEWLNAAGLSQLNTVEMPANNLAFIARKDAP